jgi:hypothetical protein
MRQRLVKSPFLDFGFLSSSELEESSLELLLLLVPKSVLLLDVTLVAGVVPIVVVVVKLVGGVELLPLGAVGDEVGGVTALEEVPR